MVDYVYVHLILLAPLFDKRRKAVMKRRPATLRYSNDMGHIDTENINKALSLNYAVIIVSILSVSLGQRDSGLNER